MERWAKPVAGEGIGTETDLHSELGARARGVDGFQVLFLSLFVGVQLLLFVRKKGNKQLKINGGGRDVACAGSSADPLAATVDGGRGSSRRPHRIRQPSDRGPMVVI
jgi:hypothetical protein